MPLLVIDFEDGDLEAAFDKDTHFRPVGKLSFYADWKELRDDAGDYLKCNKVGCKCTNEFDPKSSESTPMRKDVKERLDNHSLCSLREFVSTKPRAWCTSQSKRMFSTQPPKCLLRFPNSSSVLISPPATSEQSLKKGPTKTGVAGIKIPNDKENIPPLDFDPELQKKNAPSRNSILRSTMQPNSRVRQPDNTTVDGPMWTELADDPIDCSESPTSKRHLSVKPSSSVPVAKPRTASRPMASLTQPPAQISRSNHRKPEQPRRPCLRGRVKKTEQTTGLAKDDTVKRLLAEEIAARAVSNDTIVSGRSSSSAAITAVDPPSSLPQKKARPVAPLFSRPTASCNGVKPRKVEKGQVPEDQRFTKRVEKPTKQQPHGASARGTRATGLERKKIVAATVEQVLTVGGGEESSPSTVYQSFTSTASSDTLRRSTVSSNNTLGHSAVFSNTLACTTVENSFFTVDNSFSSEKRSFTVPLSPPLLALAMTQAVAPIR